MSARGAQARRRRRLGAGRWHGTHGRPIERFVCSFLAVLHFCGLGNDVFSWVWWLVEINTVAGSELQNYHDPQITHGLLNSSFEFQDYVS